jgi:release factor glutamine methyltransferase
MPPEARDHEARLALDGGPDGLAVLRRVAAAAPGWLTAGGHLLVETSDQQVPAAVDAFVRGGLGVEVARSENYDATVIIGSLAG